MEQRNLRIGVGTVTRVINKMYSQLGQIVNVHCVPT